MTARLLRTVLAALMVAWVSLPATQAAADPAARVQGWLDSWSTLAGRFQQVVSSPTLPENQVESGEFEIARPDRMRWDYATPETKLAVTDGQATWLYLPEDRQVIRGSMQALRRDGAVALLLSGTGTLSAAFMVREAAVEDGRLDLVLEPRTPSPAMSRVDLAATGTGRILSLTVHDGAGNRVIWSFSNLRLDPVLDDARFRFVVPPGVEVQDLGGAGMASP